MREWSGILQGWGLPRPLPAFPALFPLFFFAQKHAVEPCRGWFWRGDLSYTIGLDCTLNFSRLRERNSGHCLMKTSEGSLLLLSFLLCWELASPGPWELESTHQRSRPALDESALLNHPAPSGRRLYPDGSGFGSPGAACVHPSLLLGLSGWRLSCSMGLFPRLPGAGFTPRAQVQLQNSHVHLSPQ